MIIRFILMNRIGLAFDLGVSRLLSLSYLIKSLSMVGGIAYSLLPLVVDVEIIPAQKNR